MEKIFSYLIGLVILILLLRLFEDKLMGLFRGSGNLSYRKKDFLLNTAERKFFESIQQIIPNNYVVFPQISLKSIIEVDGAQNFRTSQNKIDRKIIDFVVFDKPYYKPILAIEYDGSTHDRADRQARDEFVDSILESSGIKIIHIKHEKNINFETIKSDILTNLRM
ncbi:MAG: DUF2726 domain-containing protein [Patescibacteria group bacterium]|jgi:very-short-patch-repair endonuclease